jgi:DNA-binding transcriptional MerR regulator/quercetin dioxygenase-like cupin family protein
MVGTTSASIRMWEKHGLVAPERTSSGYRIYSMAQVSRLRQIHRLTLDGVNSAGILLILEGETETQAAAQAFHDALQPTRSVGETLKVLRSVSRLTLRQVAERTGLSPSYVSSVERSLAVPSLPSMQRLAVAFGTNVQGLMGQALEAPDTVLVRSTERRILDSGSGVTIEDMSTASSNLESLLFTVLPGAGSDGAFSHEGEEMLYIASGELLLTLDGTDRYHIGSGDSMSYDSKRPHAWTNPGHEATVIVWVNTPRTF